MDIEVIKEDLILLNKEIDKAQKEKDEAIGARRSLLENLKKNFGYSNTDQAEDELDDLMEVIEKEKQQLVKIYQKIKKDF